ncbi:PAS domain-containing protein [Sabulicella glaciei]|uniref:histidine kinase n=1 Tax=Sabulicella glaciei TaxID=2984948 RepID=A0ABT3NT68_9PROT|nr:PAS domain-containing protein [Roseococcus sp. MDT2-1-1]MCW8085352.1 PAS domain-containing protein [Roseococcus sp. MDT2-1-1]
MNQPDSPASAALAGHARALFWAALLLPMLLTAGGAWISWIQARREAEREVAHAAEVSAEYVQRLFDGLVLRIHRANEILAGLPDEEIRRREAELHGRLRSPASMQPGDATEQEAYIFVHDRGAVPLVSSAVLPAFVGRALPNRDFNSALRGPDAPRIHVSQVHFGLSTRRPYFALTKRRVGTGNGLPPEEYDGVINASVYVEELDARLRRLASNHAEDVIALVRADGLVLARSAPVAPGARIQSSHPALPRMAQGEEHLAVTAASTLDGVTRIAAFHRVDGYPVYATAARPRASVVRRWFSGVLPLLAAALPATFGLAWMALLVGRKQRALVAANAELEMRVERRTAALRKGEERLQELVATLDLASFLTRDMEGRILSWSEGCHRLYGWSAGEARGRDTHTLLGTSFPQPRAEIEAALLRDGVWQGDLRQRRRDGRALVVNAHKALRRGPDGQPVAVVEALTDVSAHRAMEVELRASEESARLAIEGARLGAWELDAPSGLCTWSARMAEIMGEAARPRAGMTLEAWLARIHPDDAPAARDAFTRALRSGEGGEIRTEHRVRAADLSWRWVSVHGAVLSRDVRRGAALSVRGVAEDVNERKLAEERQRLLAREVDHRAKNALAVVLAAVRLTPRDDVTTYARAIEGRVSSMSRTHTLLADARWAGADLRTLAEGELEPFIGAEATGPDASPRAELSGAKLLVAAEAAQGFSLILHELATNATKYGALSHRGGLVQVQWQVDEGEGEGMLRLRWTESGGPAVAASPAHRGFGSRVIEAMAEGQLEGRVERRWDPGGLECVVTVPLSRVLATAGEDATKEAIPG